MIERTLTDLPVLRRRRYQLWMAGRLLNTFGSWMNSLAVSWWTLSNTNSPTMVGFVALSNLLPGMIVLLFFGRYFEGMSKKTVMITCLSFMAATSGALALLWSLGRLEPWMVLVFSAISGIAIVLEFPAREVFLVDMVGEDFHQTIGMEIFIPNLSRIIGMLMAGILIRFFGEGLVFAFDALSSLLMVATIILVSNGATMHKFDGDGVISRGKLKDISVPRASLLFFLLFAVNLGVVFIPLQTVVVRDIYRRDVVEAGLFGMTIGIGSVLGSFICLLGVLRTKPVQVMGMTALMHLVFAFGALATDSFLTALFSVLLLGIFGTWYVNISKMLIHMAVPHRHRAKAMRLWMLGFAFVPVVAAPAGWLCDVSGSPRLVLIAFTLLSAVLVISTILNYWLDQYFKSKNGKELG